MKGRLTFFRTENKKFQTAFYGLVDYCQKLESIVNRKDKEISNIQEMNNQLYSAQNKRDQLLLELNDSVQKLKQIILLQQRRLDEANINDIELTNANVYLRRTMSDMQKASVSGPVRASILGAQQPRATMLLMNRPSFGVQGPGPRASLTKRESVTKGGISNYADPIASGDRSLTKPISRLSTNQQNDFSKRTISGPEQMIDTVLNTQQSRLESKEQPALQKRSLLRKGMTKTFINDDTPS